MLKKKFRHLYVLVYSLLIGLLHLPFSFAKSAAGSKMFFHPPHDSSHLVEEKSVNKAHAAVYDSLHLDLAGLSRQAFEYARRGWEKLKAEGKLINDSVLSIVDFSQSSDKKRLFVIDLAHFRLLYHTLVAHGQNSGLERATQFSNKNASHMSSPGFYLTLDTYQGRNGYSLRLEGLEKGINDKAFERTIVVHGARYVSEQMAQWRGFIGRSHGCPAVPAELSAPIINSIKNGSLLFIYHPSYVSRSGLLSS